MEHRWQYLYECVQWVLPRKAALQYLKLDDIVDGEASARDPSGECEKFQLSSRHLELLANLSKSNEQSNSFWALAGLGSVLASWGHDVSNFLHSCPCHPPEKSEQRERKTKKRRGTMVEDIMHREDDTSCPMGGRMGVAMASGYMRRAVDNLKRAQVPEHTQTVLDALSEETRMSLLNCFQAAKSRLTYRVTQSFGYWTQLPWALLMIMRPFVETFKCAEKAGNLWFFIAHNFVSIVSH